MYKYIYIYIYIWLILFGTWHETLKVNIFCVSLVWARLGPQWISHDSSGKIETFGSQNAYEYIRMYYV